MGSVQSDTTTEVTFGDYVIICRVAVGGMAELFEARPLDSRDDQSTVILKVLLPQFAADDELKSNFEHEARVASAIDHENLIDVMVSGVTEGRPFLVMEKIDGPSLAAVLDVLRGQNRTLPLPLSLTIVREVLLALEAVHGATTADGHALNVVHRDVSPQNILLSRAGEVRLGDFGIALSSLRDTRTRTGVIKGKTQYLAPEQVTLSTVDHRTDLYAAGLVLWELLTGQPYLQGESDLDLLKSAENPTFHPPSTLVKELDSRHDNLTGRALARFAEQRFQSARAFLDALEELREIDPDSPDDDRLISIVEEVLSTQSVSTSSVHDLLRVRKSNPPQGDTRGTKVSTLDGRSRRIGSRIPALAIVLALAIMVSFTLLFGEGPEIAESASGGATENASTSTSPQQEGEAREVEARSKSATSPDPIVSRELDAPTPPASDSLEESSEAEVEAEAVEVEDVPVERPSPRGGPQESPSVIGEASEEQGVLAQNDARREALLRRLADLRTDLSSRGVLVTDLDASNRRLLHLVENDLNEERFDDAAMGLERAERALSAVQIDRDFIQRKLDRVDQQIRGANERGVDTERIEALERVALREFMAGRLEATNSRLNQILRSLAELERSPSP